MMLYIAQYSTYQNTDDYADIDKTIHACVSRYAIYIAMNICVSLEYRSLCSLSDAVSVTAYTNLFPAFLVRDIHEKYSLNSEFEA